MQHKIIQGDCLSVLEGPDLPLFDLVYLDPPFFTQKSHSMTTREGDLTFQFSDVWGSRSEYIQYLRSRLSKIRSALRDSGSIFFHCDSSASHVIRVLMDEIFGEENFASEIIWSYKRWSNSQRGLNPAHQTIFFYSKTSSFKFNRMFTDYSETTNADQILQRRSRDERNKSVYATDDDGLVVHGGAKKGVPLSDVWEIPFLNPKAIERVGYPTQKPVLLLERIIELVTDPGDWVLDPFCGSGTTVVASMLLGRNAVGIDISHDAVELANGRLLNPAKTESSVLRNGRSSYLPKEEYVHRMLSGLDYVPVPRNKGLDGILKRDVAGRAVFVRVQRDGESLSDAASAIRKSSVGKGNPWLLVVSTSDRAVSLYEDEESLRGVHIVPCTPLLIERQLDSLAGLSSANKKDQGGWLSTGS